MMEPMSEAKAEPCARATKAWVLTLASVASLMAALDAMVVATVLGTMRVDLGASMEALEWTVNAYTLTFAVLLLTGAALGDRLGRRRMFAAGLGLFVAASAACAMASNVRSPRRRSVAKRWAFSVASRALPSLQAPPSGGRSQKASLGSGSSGSTCLSA
jgi:MFS family permease